MSYHYVIGPDPYECAQKYHTRGNGEWKTDATDVDTALNIIFSTMSFPGEAAGRERFIDGVSMPGVPGDEVIQVWSSEAIATDRAGKTRRHTGRGIDIGLLKEIKVTDIVTYTPAGRKLLADPAASTEQKALSPIGSSVSGLSAMRYELHQKMQLTQHRVSSTLYDLERAKDSMKEQQAKMEAQLELVQTYMHGVKEVKWLTRGSRAAANQPYKIFQARQFLNREVGLLANLTDLDFNDVVSLNKWLVKSGHLWKLLPFDKTILVTKIRDENKHYGSPLTDWVLNELNVQNFIWIRDGENVMQISVDTDFNNAVFPSKKQEDDLFANIIEKVWIDCFQSGKKPDYGLSKDSISSLNPYGLRHVVLDRFDTLEAWRDSVEYAALERDINDQVFAYLRERNQDRMLFLVLMQGIVDNTSLLTIPAGTDLFRHETCSQYFELIYDYSHGLPDQTRPAAISPYLTHVTPGQWIIASYVIKSELEGRTWQNYRPTPAMFLVVKLTSEGKPIVRHRRMSKSRSYGRYRVANATSEVVEGPWIRADLPAKMADDILDVRDWKIAHAWVVPMLAQWRMVQRKFIKCPSNHLEIRLKEAEE